MNQNHIELFDRTNPSSIEAYAKRLEGHTFREVISWNLDGAESVDEYFSSRSAKGSLGHLLEKHYFHYDINSDQNPDFAEAGVELKATPYKKNTNGSFSAKERLVITLIDYKKVVNEPFDESHLMKKGSLILLVYYLFLKDIDKLDYMINHVQLFQIPKEDLPIIKEDYNKIITKIREGKAHELSEGDTLYLGACTKGMTAESSLREQPFSDTPARQRAFCFKVSYMTYILNNYILSGKRLYEPIQKEEAKIPLEQYVISCIARYKNVTVKELCSEFNIDIEQKPKNLGAMIAYRILGISGNKAEEFVKAGVVVKTIRIGTNGRIRENMSFPAFKFTELIKEKWEDSTFGNYLRETRFLFVVYRFDDKGELRLKGAQFWNMPYDDIEDEVFPVWEKTCKVIRDGLIIQIKNGRNVCNFPKQSENRVCHVRPHAKNTMDTYNLPDGRPFPKQCFWLNNSYILSQIGEELKEE